MSQQRTVALQSTQESVVNLEESQEGRDTQVFLYEYLSRRVTADDDMSERDASLIRGQREAVRGADAAAQVAGRLADLGDEIDFQYKQEMDEIIALTESPETAFTLFYDVVKNLFEWDQQGGAKINVGRIAALLAYCYSLCKAFISKRVGGGGLIISFMGMVAGWLFKFLIQAKFYEWLRSHGGWGQLVSNATGSMLSWPMGRHTFLVVGMASLAIWAWSYFRNSS